jgi:hypothetical protein
MVDEKAILIVVAGHARIDIKIQSTIFSKGKNAYAR